MSELSIIVGLSGLIVLVVFVGGWVLGGSHKEDALRIKGLEDVNNHYRDMANNYSKIDETVDRVNSLLDPRGVRENTTEPVRSPADGAPSDSTDATSR